MNKRDLKTEYPYEKEQNKQWQDKQPLKQKKISKESS